jgi:hypothetical protein
MVEVWRRPSLTAIEVGWRWLLCAPLLLLCWRLVSAALGEAGFEILSRGASSLSVLRLLESTAAMREVFRVLWPRLIPLVRFFVPAFLLAWPVVASVGRTFLLRRFDPELKTRRPTFALLALLQLSKLVAMLGTWVGCWALAVRVAIVAPTARHEDSNLVLFAAMIIGLTLLVFVGRSMTSWILQLASLIAMTRNVSVRKSIVMAIRAPKALRSQLIETNLIMGIVKVALLVLAMVFSACPLPFSSVETQGFLTCWWIGVGVWWLLASDYFHVVRMVAVLRLLKANDFPGEQAAAEGRDAS